MTANSVRSRPILAGVVTSIIAALIMAVVVMAVFAIFLGKSPLYPVQLIGAMFLGGDYLAGLNVGLIGAGLIFHLVICGIWGIVFGILAGAVGIETTGKALAYGLVLGVVSMIDVYVIDPAIMAAMGRPDIWNAEVPIAWDWAAHIVFGASFAFFPAVHRWLTKETRPAA